MVRLRWVLVLLALGIGLPAVLIVQRASEALRLEDAYRHETVAERVFDEMERSFSDFLVREESRPTSDYDEAEPAGSREPVVPLPARFANADEPFIVGWFVLPSSNEPRAVAAEPSARRRIEAALQTALAPQRPRRDLDAIKERIEQASDDAMAKTERRIPGLGSRPAPAPGRTSSIGRARADEERLADLDAKEIEEPSTYEVLQNLNRAGSLRSERQSKARMKRNKDDADASSFADIALSAPALSSLDKNAPPSGVTESEDLGAAQGKAIFETPVVDPLVGRMTTNGSLVLTRSVWRGQHVERQGVVLDRDLLIEWIGQRVLGETGLADRASLEFAPFPQGDEGAQYRYAHRFNEPFDELVARLDLEPLPAPGAARSIPALATLLAFALIVGLVAVDRMTRVVVEYAERRSNFVAAVSHELRTPLTAIRMYAEMLRDGLVTSESKRNEYYATMTDESERLSRLIDNVLEFSRLEQDRRRLDLVVGGLSETVCLAAEKLSAHAAREGFRLELDLPTTLPRVRYDRDAVTQIVFNLVDNALKYARSAENKEIDVRLLPVAGGVELRVRDFGPGIPADQRNRIFEPFYRIGDELTRTTEGTGIGLALVRELAAGMGGSVRAEQPVGGGLEIVLSFDPEDV